MSGEVAFSAIGHPDPGGGTRLPGSLQDDDAVTHAAEDAQEWLLDRVRRTSRMD